MSVLNHRQEIWAGLKRAKLAMPEDGDASKLKQFYEKELEINKEAIELFERLAEFARYRDKALERLAALHSCTSRMSGHEDHAEIAIRYLETLLDEGATTQYGIRSMPEFKFLAEHPDYERLADAELSLDANGRYRRGGLRSRLYDRW